MSSFAPPANAAPPSNVFEGRLYLVAVVPGAGFRVLVDHFGNVLTDSATALSLPPFDFDFVQSGDAIIPLVRGAIAAKGSDYEFILEPGRVWDEPGDEAYTRAAIPFALEERNENCMHNGVLTFLFRSDGRVSNVAYEVASETCAYLQFDAWGFAAARYKGAPIQNKAFVVAQYHAELAERLPVKPIGLLSSVYPRVDPAHFGLASEIDPAAMTLYGVVADGINYVGGCATRQGPYPYCDVLDLPSYSVAKSIAAALATMRLAVSYPQLTSTRISDYVPACAKNGSWGGVTIGNALDMSTGHFASIVSMSDEYSEEVSPFFTAESHDAKIAFACNHFPRKEDPGKRWVYHTTDTYVLGTALGGFYRAKAGATADLYHDVLVGQIWTPLHLSPPTAVTRRTYDAVQQPFMGYGVTLHRDDIAKLATFINVAHGAINGHQIVSPEMLDDALRRHATHPALEASSVQFNYKNGFWAWNAQQALGCSKPAWIPFMLGYGGIVVALFPNGVTYYYFSDGGVFKWQAAAVEADKLRPICKR